MLADGVLQCNRARRDFPAGGRAQGFVPAEPAARRPRRCGRRAWTSSGMTALRLRPSAQGEGMSHLAPLRWKRMLARTRGGSTRKDSARVGARAACSSQRRTQPTTSVAPANAATLAERPSVFGLARARWTPAFAAMAAVRRGAMRPPEKRTGRAHGGEGGRGRSHRRCRGAIAFRRNRWRRCGRRCRW